jgi:D-alanyl-D-alanine carboxypeptidase
MNGEILRLLADPGGLDTIPSDALPELIGEAAALQARLWARLQMPAAPPPAPARPAAEDQLLSAVAAGALLGVSKRWMYRHAESLPFTRRLTDGTLRFSARGLERWKESRRG